MVKTLNLQLSDSGSIPGHNVPDTGKAGAANHYHVKIADKFLSKIQIPKYANQIRILEPNFEISNIV